MYNRIQLMGYVGQTPAIRLTQDGRSIMTFSLATYHSWKNKEGEWKRETLWHHVTVYKDSVMKWIETHIGRGSCIFVEGELAYVQWQDRDQHQREKAYIAIRGPQGRIYPLRSSGEEKERMQDLILKHANGNIKQEDILSPQIGNATKESKNEQ